MYAHTRWTGWYLMLIRLLLMIPVRLVTLFIIKRNVSDASPLDIGFCGVDLFETLKSFEYSFFLLLTQRSNEIRILSRIQQLQVGGYFISKYETVNYGTLCLFFGTHTTLYVQFNFDLVTILRSWKSSAAKLNSITLVMICFCALSVRIEWNTLEHTREEQQRKNQ